MSNSATAIDFTCSTTRHRDYAVYLPAIQPMYACKVVRTDIDQKLPYGLAANDLNYFDPTSRLFTLSAALYSAGNISNLRQPPACMVSQRARGKRQKAVVLGDSGGYQIGRGKLKATPTLVKDIFYWLTTYCDAAMTLDIPAWALDSGDLKGYSTFSECLAGSIGYLDQFVALGAREFPFLNVLHGRTLDEADVWYEAVKSYNLYGWAMGASTRYSNSAGKSRGLCLIAVLWRIIALLADGKFDRDSIWLHFLGIGDLKTALLLSTLKNTLNSLLPNCKVEVTFDTSSPSQGARFLRGVSSYRISPTSLAYEMREVSKPQWANNISPLPFELSSIGRLLTQQDVVCSSPDGEELIQPLGYLILENNNVQATVRAIDAAHQILNYGLSEWQLNQIFPYHLLDAISAIEKVLTQPSLKEAKAALMSPESLRVLGAAYQNASKYR